MILFFVVLGYLALMSVVTFGLYASDKHRTVRKQRRIPEKVLLLMSFLGGAAGGFAAMQLVRHKTKAEHWYFTVVNVLGILWQAAVLAVLFVYKPL